MEKIEKTKNECYIKDTCNKFKQDRCIDDYCQKLYTIDILYDLTLLTDAQRKRLPLYPDADGTDSDKFQQLHEFEENILNHVKKGDNLYIYSTICGNGKSSWAIRMIQSFIQKIWIRSKIECKALFINVPKFLLALKDNITTKNDYVEHIKENVLSANLVVWDEIGCKGLTDFEHENILNLINSRLDEGKSNIYTSNLSGEELRMKIGDRLYSRIVNYSTPVELNGQDKRSLFK